MTDNPEFRSERTSLAGRLARQIGLSLEEIDQAIDLQNDSYLPEKRNLIGVLATVAQLVALTEDLNRSGRTGWWQSVGSDGRSPAHRLKAGEISAVCRDLIDERAGRYDVAWDQQWPPSVARRRMIERLPVTARRGDILTGGDGGARLKLRVIETENGRLTAEPIEGSWVDPPFEEVAGETYKRLASQFPSIPPPTTS
jgi:hypothetical protein